jgi:gas vesicle protein
MNKDLPIGYGIGLLTGALIGGVAALLFAPVSGKKTRQFIGDKANEVVEMVKEKTNRISDTVKKEVASEASQEG